MIAVIVPLTRPHFAPRIIEMFRAQEGAEARLVFALNGPGLALAEAPPDVECVRTRHGKGAALNDVLPQLPDAYCCVWDDDDVYGPGYLAEVARCAHLGPTGLAAFDYRLPDGSVSHVFPGGYQGGTLAFPTRGMPAWREGMDICAELLWRRELEREGLQIHPRAPGHYTYCRYDAPEHRHVFPFHPQFNQRPRTT